jgi:hypothetical protein
MERLPSRLRKECAAPVADRGQHSQIEHDDIQELLGSEVTRETATERRFRELSELVKEGLPILYINKWQVRIGSLLIWVAAGRWMNEATGARGKLNSTSIRKLITTVNIPEPLNQLTGL